MYRLLLMIMMFFCLPVVRAQDVMTPELLWGLGRVSPVGISVDGASVVYAVTRFDAQSNTSERTLYRIPIRGGEAVTIENADTIVPDKHLSPDGRYVIRVRDIKIDSVAGADHYPALEKSNALIYDDLMYRHWDTWEDGAYSHLILDPAAESSEEAKGIDIMMGEPYDCPLKPFGGEEDYTWSPDSKKILYVAKKYAGKAYALGTNSDIYAYDLESGRTTNLTASNKGYDTQPAFSPDGRLAWLRMETPGYEADKNDIILSQEGLEYNLTADWDGTVNAFSWSLDGNRIYFVAPVSGTVHLFEVGTNPAEINAGETEIRQVTAGQFDIRGIVGQSGNIMVVSRTDMNHAVELYTVDLDSGDMQQLTHVNDGVYQGIALSNVEKRMVRTTDGKEMLTWVIYPPGFDSAKKYPTLLYCQGGPQGALSQFYSFRWNFQVMAAQGYIIVAPNRRGMPGHGVEWNAQISGDWGGQNMQDYLSAIDALREEPFVDEDRLGCIGASYGGYSVFYLAGIHKGRFKSFIAHDGIFNMESMYGTTEELFFVNYEWGGPYWEDNATARKTYTSFNPIKRVEAWDTPILIIHGGRDYRVPVSQALEAFQAAQLLDIKSRFLYFPEENHWVLSPQNGLVWQREFFRWLRETL